jgi:hypothetical protein
MVDYDSAMTDTAPPPEEPAAAEPASVVDQLTAVAADLRAALSGAIEDLKAAAEAAVDKLDAAVAELRASRGNG